MADPVGLSTTIIGLISTVQGLISSIKQIASNVRCARNSAENLATRCAKIKYSLQRIENFPDCHNEALKSHLDQFVDIFNEVKQFLLKFERKGAVATCKRILKDGKYVAKYDELERSLNIAIFDLTLWQTINFPNDRWDNEGTLPADQPHSFPPTLEEMAPTAEVVFPNELVADHGSDVEEEPNSFEEPNDCNETSKIPWDFVPRIHLSANFGSYFTRSESGSCYTNLQRKKGKRRDLYQGIQTLHNLDQNTRIHAFRVCVCQLEAVTMASNALGILSPLLGLSPQFRMIALSIPSHSSVEFVLSNGVIGTMENCVDDVYLYAGKSSRKEKHCVLIVDLDKLGIERTLGMLIQFRNEHRKTAYSVEDNNCMHFAFHAVMFLAGNHNFDLLGSEFLAFVATLQMYYALWILRFPRWFLRLQLILKCNEDGKLEWKEGPVTDNLRLIFKDLA